MGKDFLSNINSIKMPGEYPISKYRKVIKKADPAQESEIRVRVNSPPFAYAAYAGKLLPQKDFDYVYLNATGAAVSNSIKVIEYLKTHIKGLHISYNILSKEFVDEYEPKVEGLDKVTTTRTVSTLEAKLTIKKGDELAKEVGYMAPSANEEDIDQKGFEESMLKYNERKATKESGSGGEKRGGERGGRGRGGRGRGGDRRGGDNGGYKRNNYNRGVGDRRPRTDSGRYNDDRREGGDSRVDNRRGGDRRDDREGGDRRRNDNRDGGDRRPRNDDNRRGGDRRDNRTEGGDRRRNDDNRGGDRRENRTDNYDNRRRNDDREGGDRRRNDYENKDGGDRRRNDYDNRDGGDRRRDDRGGRGRGEG